MAKLTVTLPYPEDGGTSWRLNVPLAVERGYVAHSDFMAQTYSIDGVEVESIRYHRGDRLILGLTDYDNDVIIRFKDRRLADLLPPGYGIDDEGTLTFDPEVYGYENRLLPYYRDVMTMMRMVTVEMNMAYKIDRDIIVGGSLGGEHVTQLRLYVTMGTTSHPILHLLAGTGEICEDLPILDAIYVRQMRRDEFRMFEFPVRGIHFGEVRANAVIDKLNLAQAGAVHPVATGKRHLDIGTRPELATSFVSDGIAMLGVDDSLSFYRQVISPNDRLSTFGNKALIMRGDRGWSFLFLLPRFVTFNDRTSYTGDSGANRWAYPAYIAVPVHVGDAEVFDRPGPKWPALGRLLSTQVNAIPRLSLAMSHALNELASFVKKRLLDGVRVLSDSFLADKLPKHTVVLIPEAVESLASGSAQRVLRGVRQRYESQLGGTSSGYRASKPRAANYATSLINLLSIHYEVSSHDPSSLLPYVRQAVADVPATVFRRRLVL